MNEGLTRKRKRAAIASEISRGRVAFVARRSATPATAPKVIVSVCGLNVGCGGLTVRCGKAR